MQRYSANWVRPAQAERGSDDAGSAGDPRRRAALLSREVCAGAGGGAAAVAALAVGAAVGAAAGAGTDSGVGVWAFTAGGGAGSIDAGTSASGGAGEGRAVSPGVALGGRSSCGPRGSQTPLTARITTTASAAMTTTKADMRSTGELSSERFGRNAAGICAVSPSSYIDW